MTHEQHEKNRHYLASVAIGSDMFRRGIIGEADYAALEDRCYEKFRPLFRYEKPCLSPTLPITQTIERGA